MDWFYTTDKQQMGPVTWKELVELAAGGILKPHDLVWTEGMDEWVKAIHQKGLFTDADAEEKVTSKKASYTQPKPPPGRRTSRSDDDEDEDEEDEREAKKKARKREEDRARTGVGIKVGLILAGVLFVLLLMVCGGGTLLWFSFRGAGGGGGDGVRRENFTVSNLPQKTISPRSFTFTQGKRVIITCTNTTTFDNTDVDLLVFRGRNAVPNELPIFADVRLPKVDRNCRLEFVVPATDTYRVTVHNLGPGHARSCVVNIEER